jgi:hypothetical protein
LAPSAVAILAVMPPTLVIGTTDGGKSWALVPWSPTPVATDRPRCLNSAHSVVSPVDPAVLYVWCPTALVDSAASIASNPGETPLWRSDDGGAAWARVKGPGQLEPNSYAVDPLTRNRLWAVGTWQAGTGSPLYTAAFLSDDGGLSWHVRRVPKAGVGSTTSISVGVFGGRRTVVVSSAAGVWLSTNPEAKVWKQLNQPRLAEAKVAVPRPGGGLSLEQTKPTSCASDLQLRLLTTKLRQLSVARPLPRQLGHVRQLGAWTGTPEGGVIGLAEVNALDGAACAGVFPQPILVWTP